MRYFDILDNSPRPAAVVYWWGKEGIIMENRRFVKLREEPRRLEAAAAWFHQKWGIPQEAYRASMEECLLARRCPSGTWR